MPSLTLLGQSVLSGVFIGALYGLLGLGLSLSWGMLRQVNLAHFALAFLGGYLTFQLSGRVSSIDGDAARWQRYEDLRDGLLFTGARAMRETKVHVKRRKGKPLNT